VQEPASWSWRPRSSSLSVAIASEAELVTVENFERAETDRTMRDYVNLGGFGKFHHIRNPVPIDEQAVVRMQSTRCIPSACSI
jgi:hypothetical protein